MKHFLHINSSGVIVVVSENELKRLVNGDVDKLINGNKGFSVCITENGECEEGYFEVNNTFVVI